MVAQHISAALLLFVGFIQPLKPGFQYIMQPGRQGTLMRYYLLFPLSVTLLPGGIIDASRSC
jgi:hypothetical protein